MKELTVAEATRDYEERVRIFSSLVDMPGWRLFEAQLQAEAKQLYGAAMRTTDGVMMGKALGGYDALTKMANWPREQAEGSLRMLEHMKEGGHPVP